MKSTQKSTTVVEFYESQHDAGRRIARMNTKMAEEEASGKVEPWFLYFTDPEKQPGSASWAPASSRRPASCPPSTACTNSASTRAAPWWPMTHRRTMCPSGIASSPQTRRWRSSDTGGGRHEAPLEPEHEVDAEEPRRSSG